MTKTGIDPLVAQAEYMVENPSAWECFDQRGSDTIAKLIAGYRSQAERITALEVEIERLLPIEAEAQEGVEIVGEMRERIRHLEIDCQQWLVDYEERGNALSAERQLRKDAEAERDGWKQSASDNLDEWQPKAEAAESFLAEAREALERIEKWFGEFPDTGKTWPDGSPMSYAACYGSNGERDFMRSIARATLSRLKPGEKGGGE